MWRCQKGSSTFLKGSIPGFVPVSVYKCLRLLQKRPYREKRALHHRGSHGPYKPPMLVSDTPSLPSVNALPFLLNHFTRLPPPAPHNGNGITSSSQPPLSALWPLLATPPSPQADRVFGFITVICICVSVCTNAYKYNLPSPFLLSVYGFRADHFVFSNQQGGSSLGEADFPSPSCHS